MEEINRLMIRLEEITNQIKIRAMNKMLGKKIGGGYDLNSRPVVNTFDA